MDDLERRWFDAYSRLGHTPVGAPSPVQMEMILIEALMKQEKENERRDNSDNHRQQ